MPRPKPLEPKVRIHITLPKPLYARLRLMFFTDANEFMLMKGAISDFTVAAIQEKLERSKSWGSSLQSSQSSSPSSSTT